MQNGDGDPRALRSSPAPLTAKDLYDAIEAHVTQMLADAKEGEYLMVEYHTPSGAVLHVTDFGYISSDLLVLGAKDPKQQACQVLVHPSALQLVMTFEQGRRPAQRRAIGFLGDRRPPAIRGGTEKPDAE